jgi:hypothetical protein
MNLFQEALCFWFFFLLTQQLLFLVVLLWYRKKLQNQQDYTCTRRCYLILTYLFSLFHITCLLLVLSIFRIFVGFLVLCLMLYCILHICFLSYHGVNVLVKCYFYVLSLSLSMCVFILNILLINFFCSDASDHQAFDKFYYFILITSSMGVVSSFSNVLYFFISYSNYSREELTMLTMIKVDSISTNEEDCPICLERLNSSEDKTVVKTGCEHKFHSICIRESLNTSDKCPMCRHTFYFHPCL